MTGLRASMADLTSCYFCGTIDGPLTAQSVVPEDLDPDPDAQRTVDVCTSCGEKLTTLKGIVVRAAAGDAADRPTDAETGGDGTPGVGAADPADGGTVDGEAVQDDAVDDLPDDEPSDESADDDTADDLETGRDERPDRPGDDHEPVQWPPIDDGSEGDEPANAAGDGEAPGDAKDSAGGPSETAGDGSDGADGSETVYGGGYRAGDRTREDGSVESDDGGGTGELPDGTRQVVRLLQNREFPVVRTDIETVAENAYGLEPGQAHRAVDALVENGALVEEAGSLHRPQDLDEGPG